MSESNKKAARTFSCRNALWSTFEEMARELECSVDYLINDAMKQYARQRGFGPDAGRPESSATDHPIPRAPAPPPPASQSSHGAPPPPRAPHSPAPAPLSASLGPQSPQPFVRAPAPPAPVPVPHLGAASSAPPPPRPQADGSVSQSFAAPAPGPVTQPSRPPLPPPGMSRAPAPPPPLGLPGARAQGAPPLPQPSLGAAPPARPRTQALTLHFQGNSFAVNKERFVIGRGKTASDLTIADANVSRQHAAIEFSGGAFFMVDLGSTNGIEFQGQRVQRKAIQNGDVFRICDYEIFCSLG